MAVTDKEVLEFEEKYKNTIDDKIVDLSSKQAGIILKINDTGKSIDIDTNLPNIGITFRNKLNELSKNFKDSGLSIYSSIHGEDTSNDVSFVQSSFLGDCILNDIISKVLESTQTLDNYTNDLKALSDAKTKKIQDLEKTGSIGKFFWKIRAMIFPKTIEEFKYSKEELNPINGHLQNYREKDEELWKYNLNDNIIDSIVKYVKEQGYGESTVDGIVDDNLIPDLKKLGLEKLIPKLKESITNEYEKDEISNYKTKSWELSPEQKEEIQKSSVKIAKDYISKTENTKSVILDDNIRE